MAAGGSALRILAVPGAMPLRGGLPIVVEGRIVGWIGVSGVLASQDEMVAKAGLEALGARWPAMRVDPGRLCMRDCIQFGST